MFRKFFLLLSTLVISFITFNSVMAQGLVPVAVSDINTTPRLFYPSSVCGNTGMFVADDGIHGSELWKGDGTFSGSQLVKDIYAGPISSSPGGCTAMGGYIYFAATNSANGRELWRSDGTSAGTTLVVDLQPGANSTSFYDFAVLNDSALIFSAFVDLGVELYRSDGTAAGTSLLKDIEPGSGHSAPSGFKVVNSKVIFSATTTAFGTELWSTDGTEVGTVRISDFAPGNVSSSISLTQTSSAVLLNKLYFAVNTAATGTELGVSDGTQAGTQLIEVLPGVGSGVSLTGEMLAYNNLVYFSGTSATTGSELFSTGGTPGTTQVAVDLIPGAGSGYGYPAKVIGNNLILVAQSGGTGYELFRSDGTLPGTSIISDLEPGPVGSITQTGWTRVPNIERLFYRATTSSGGSEIFQTDGFSISRLADLCEGICDSNGLSVLKVANNVFFRASPAVSNVDNSAFLLDQVGLTLNKIAGSVTARNSSSNPTFLGSLGNRAIFSADDGVHGVELWASDGTSTSLLADIRAGWGSGVEGKNATVAGGKLFFVGTSQGEGSELWVTDGTPSGTSLVKDINPGAASGMSYLSRFATLNNKVYFVANSPATGAELWSSDGTGLGTTNVKDIAVGGSGSMNPSASIVMSGGKLFFPAVQSGSGTELFISDGTDPGTFMLKDIRVGGNSSSPFSFYANPFTNILTPSIVFMATDAATGAELYKSDGTPGGTVLLGDLASGTASSSLAANVEFVSSTTAIAAIYNNSTGSELYKVDLAGVSASLIGEIAPGSSSGVLTNGYPNDLTLFGSSVFFGGCNYPTPLDGNCELWKIDPPFGAANMSQVSDLRPGNSSFYPGLLGIFNGRMYFLGYTDDKGYELYSTDGSAGGTKFLADTNPGVANFLPSTLQAAGTNALFSGTLSGRGVELFKLSSSLCPAGSPTNFPGICGCSLVDSDEDADGLFTCQDGCPSDTYKGSGGVCGCGIADDGDADRDGSLDCVDACALDASKRSPGSCGCGHADADLNGDLILDCSGTARTVAKAVTPQFGKLSSGKGKIILVLEKFAKTKNTSFIYKVNVTGPKKFKKTLESKSNKITINNLVKGKYTVKYSIISVTKSGKKITRVTSKASAKLSVTVS